MYKKKQQPLTYPEVLAKLMRFCAYQERSEFEMEQKLKEFGLVNTDNDLILDYLIDENFISNERFAAAFVKGKVSVKRWGRYKIKQGLSLKGIRGEAATAALSEIDEALYEQNFNALAEKKILQLEGKDNAKEKLYRFLLSKGYESDLIMKVLKKY